MGSLRFRALAVSATLCVGLVPATASAKYDDKPGKDQAKHEADLSKKLRKEVTVEGILAHERAFQTHSNLNGGNRVAGSPGFNASADYVKAKAEAAGYEVSENTFDFVFNADATPPVLRKVSPGTANYVDGVDFSSMTFSGSITPTTASVWAVDLVLPTKALGTSGCESADFTGMPAGSIALMQRGTCPFGQKTDNAIAAGAIAAVIFNDGADAGRLGVINGTLGAGTHGPAVGTSNAVGNALANGVSNGATGTTATIKIDRIAETRTTRNIIAETPNGDPDNVVVVGAHLDSVPRGPGINDNGSGSATILEIAQNLAKVDDDDDKGKDRPHKVNTRNKLRFMWYSAEEFGLLGSAAYVAGLSQAQKDRITAMINFDMVASPNYMRGVYDGDNSGFPVGVNGTLDGPQGSGEIERIFRDYFPQVGLTSGETPFSGRSDYGPFLGAGIPAGGLFTGAEGIKTAGQAAVYGGTAGAPYDACYHLACDTIDNLNTQGLSEMSDAAAHTTMVLAYRNYDKYPLVDPAEQVKGTDGLPAGGGATNGHEDDLDR